MTNSLIREVVTKARAFKNQNPKNLGRELVLNINTYTLLELRMADCVRYNADMKPYIENIRIELNDSLEDYEYYLCVVISKNNLMEEYLREK